MQIQCKTCTFCLKINGYTTLHTSVRETVAANVVGAASDVDERPRGENSSDMVPNDDMDVIRLIPSALGRFRTRGGPGSLSTVANEIADTPLGMSVDDME